MCSRTHNTSQMLAIRWMGDPRRCAKCMSEKTFLSTAGIVLLFSGYAHRLEGSTDPNTGGSNYSVQATKAPFEEALIQNYIQGFEFQINPAFAPQMPNIQQNQCSWTTFEQWKMDNKFQRFVIDKFKGNVFRDPKLPHAAAEFASPPLFKSSSTKNHY